jgi:hypothetical protein
LRARALGQPAGTVLALLARAFLLRRLFGGGRRANRYGRYGGYRSRGRGGFFGPLPYYSRRTRGGGRVTVSGCCLPIPLMLTLSAAAGLRALVRR